MSSISSSDRARQDDRVRQTREEYESREAENAKKKKSEISRMQQRHDEEVKNITADYEDRIAELKQRNRETLNERDHANNKKIQDMRGLYRESLRSKMEDAEINRQAQRNAYEGELRKQKQVNESQKGNLISQMNDEINARDQRFIDTVEQSREKAQASVKDNARKLNDAHGRERDALLSSHEETLNTRQRAEQEMRRSYENRLKESERRREADNSRWSQKYTDTVRNKTEEYSENLDMKQMIMDGERRNIRDKYENALANKSQTMDKQNEEFRDSVNERLNTQVRSRDSKIQTLNSRLNNEISKNDRLRSIERKNLTEAYEKRLALADETREDAITRMKELNDGRIDKIVSKTDRLMRNTERENRSQTNLTNSRHREEKETLKMAHADQIAQVSNTAETRVRKIKDLSLKNNEQMGRYFEDSMEQMKTNYMDRVDAQREKATSDQVALNKVMTERFRGMESSFNAKMEQTIKSYEDKIAQLKDGQAQEIKRLERQFAERTKNQEKAGGMEKESLSMKYEAKLAQLNESHQDQLDRMNRRHQEDMQNLSLKMSSYSRKA